MATTFTLAVPFALIFMTISNQLNWEGFVVGYVFSIIALRLGQAYKLNFKRGKVHSQVYYLLVYSVQLTWDIFVSSVNVARMVLSRDIDAQIKPGVLTISTQDATNNEIATAMSAHGITITPGQLVIDITQENNETLLHVHNLDIDEYRETIVSDQTRRLHLVKKILGYI
jgi:multisubunit Na+/H+ antiporter MnhE subunit